MKCPVHIQTSEGINAWQAIYSQYLFSKHHNLIDWFQSHCRAEARTLERDIIEFVESNNIDKRPECMLQFKQMSDKFSLINYFGKAKYL